MHIHQPSHFIRICEALFWARPKLEGPGLEIRVIMRQSVNKSPCYFKKKKKVDEGRNNHCHVDVTVDAQREKFFDFFFNSVRFFPSPQSYTLNCNIFRNTNFMSMTSRFVACCGILLLLFLSRPLVVR